MPQKDLDKWYRVEHVEYEEKPPESPKQTFKLPVWIPYPVSWLRAIILTFIFVIVGFTARFFSFYGGIFSSGGNLAPLIIFGLLGLTTPFVFMAYVHDWLLGKKPEKWNKKLPAPNSIREATTAFAAMILATLFTLIISFPFGDILAKQSTQKQAEIFVSIWFIVSLYLFQLDFLTRRRRQSKKQKEPVKLQRK